jgi:hypothetical protein
MRWVDIHCPWSRHSAVKLPACPSCSHFDKIIAQIWPHARGCLVEMREVNHRAKNMLSVVDSIAHPPPETRKISSSASPSAFSRCQPIRTCSSATRGIGSRSRTGFVLSSRTSLISLVLASALMGPSCASQRLARKPSGSRSTNAPPTLETTGRSRRRWVASTSAGGRIAIGSR